ncbi:MAG: hypothetical protein ACBR12_04925 [Microcoleus sp.]
MGDRTVDSQLIYPMPMLSYLNTSMALWTKSIAQQQSPGEADAG